MLSVPEDALVSDYMETDLVTLGDNDDPEAVAREMSNLDFPALPVINERGKLVGIARTEEMLDVVEEEASEDILKSAGFSFTDVEASRSSAILESSIARILRLRMPWLLVVWGLVGMGTTRTDRMGQMKTVLVMVADGDVDGDDYNYQWGVETAHTREYLDGAISEDEYVGRVTNTIDELYGSYQYGGSEGRNRPIIGPETRRTPRRGVFGVRPDDAGGTSTARSVVTQDIIRLRPSRSGTKDS